MMKAAIAIILVGMLLLSGCETFGKAVSTGCPSNKFQAANKAECDQRCGDLCKSANCKVTKAEIKQGKEKCSWPQGGSGAGPTTIGGATGEIPIIPAPKSKVDAMNWCANTQTPGVLCQQIGCTLDSTTVSVRRIGNKYEYTCAFTCVRAVSMCDCACEPVSETKVTEPRTIRPVTQDVPYSKITRSTAGQQATIPGQMPGAIQQPAYPAEIVQTPVVTGTPMPPEYIQVPGQVDQPYSVPKPLVDQYIPPAMPEGYQTPTPYQQPYTVNRPSGGASPYPGYPTYPQGYPQMPMPSTPYTTTY